MCRSICLVLGKRMVRFRCIDLLISCNGRVSGCLRVQQISYWSENYSHRMVVKGMIVADWIWRRAAACGLRVYVHVHTYSSTSKRALSGTQTDSRPCTTLNSGGLSISVHPAHTVETKRVVVHTSRTRCGLSQRSLRCVRPARRLG